jgi:retinol dehydrogenase-12
MADMTDRICVVTGANTGIGKETALGLARMGARVVLACRSEDKTRPVIDEIASETGTSPDFLALDLGSLARVRAAAAELLDRGHPIHVLVNNAGLAGQRGETADGFELEFGVNHLGPYLFTRLLLDRIVDSAPARIVNVASGSHYQVKGEVDWNVKGKTRSVTGLKEYARSKLANVLFTVELARRLDGTGVTTYSLHPGVIASDIWRRLPWPVRPIAKKFMKSPEEGAQTSIYCATAPELAGETGLYYDDCKPKRPSRLARDEALATEMWNRSADWVGLPAD